MPEIPGYALGLVEPGMKRHVIENLAAPFFTEARL
jgi:hypothetical protein